MFKKILISFSIFSFLLVPAFAGAVNLDSGGLLKKAQKTSGYADGGANPELMLAENVGKIISVALSLIGTIFTVLIVYSGFLWMTAAGEATQVDKAKQILTSSIIGLVIVLAAYSLSNFIVGKMIDTTLS